MYDPAAERLRLMLKGESVDVATNLLGPTPFRTGSLWEFIGEVEVGVRSHWLGGKHNFSV